VDEALCNVIRHGYEQRGDGSIEVCVWPMAGEDAGGSGDDPGAVGGGLYIRIEDRGRQTEPDHIRSRELTEIRPGGLGVHIIKEVMDYVRYDKREGGGMRLTMMKRAGGSGGGGDAASVPRAGRACDSATGAE
jgi:anti-sigma regulatory factor (Ser/Thr protein kinase)